MRRHTVQKKQFLAVIISSCAKIDIPHLEASKSLAKSCHYFKYHSFSTWEYFSSQWSKMPLKNFKSLEIRQKVKKSNFGLSGGMVLSFIGTGFHRGSWFLLREKCFQGRSLPPEGRPLHPERSEGCNRDPRGVKTARGYTFVWAGINFRGEIQFWSRMVLSFILAEIPTPSECLTLRKAFKGL